jgi:hypothetical protein
VKLTPGKEERMDDRHTLFYYPTRPSRTNSFAFKSGSAPYQHTAHPRPGQRELAAVGADHLARDAITLLEHAGILEVVMPADVPYTGPLLEDSPRHGNREFLEFCDAQATGKQRWSLSHAKVPQQLQTDQAMRHLMRDFARRQEDHPGERTLISAAGVSGARDFPRGEMNNVIFPLKPQMMGPEVADLQNALRQLLERSAILDDDEDAHRELATALRREREVETFGDVTRKLAGVFQEARRIEASGAVENALLREGGGRSINRSGVATQVVSGEIRREDGVLMRGVRVHVVRSHIRINAMSQ